MSAKIGSWSCRITKSVIAPCKAVTPALTASFSSASHRRESTAAPSVRRVQQICALQILRLRRRRAGCRLSVHVFAAVQRRRPTSPPGAEPPIRFASVALIAEGALDGEGNSVEKMAERLGLGERQLRRLFLQHLGASPISVAQTRRVLFAKQLIHETRCQ